MALWLPSENKLYLPPTAVSRVVSTDEYVTRTSLFYYAGSSRLLAVGNPYFPVKKSDGTIAVPMVSGNQYRVFRVTLPDPNKFGLPDASLYNPDKQRLVWACVGVEVGRGQPLGIGLSGNPLFNKLEDTENPTKYVATAGTDNRQNVAIDNKQTQLCIIGCTPPVGEHWGKGNHCDGVATAPGDCPALELVNSVIQDGDMVDTGFGAMDFSALQTSKSDVPLDIANAVCKYPDYLKMASEVYGDSLFFYLRREQLFARHFFSRAGTVGDTVPEDLYIKGNDSQSQKALASSVYVPTPSGSMVTSEAQLFNKPYWLQRAQGHNNGVCWENQLFVTVVDTTRSTNMTLSATATTEATYKASNFKQYTRHCEEFDLQFIFQLCIVDLSPEVMAYIHTMNPDILDSWNLGIQPPPTGTLEDTYRYLKSEAIRCQAKVPPKEKVDPYDKYSFWKVDLRERFSSDLDQYPLGRKFLLQSGLRARPRLPKPPSRKRPSVIAPPPTASTSVAAAAKRRRR
ncbi:early protein L1 [Saimiri sciureus papillomavirus 2]|uniref:Major capsid protein L1 n=1 Tax=Saimiri sciureus papillomavirus 2 TaxID=990305 RepID=W5QK83_9PAPI|nr:early protein L1 [Saimiri sciureus papillomavirus 2]